MYRNSLLLLLLNLLLLNLLPQLLSNQGNVRLLYFVRSLKSNLEHYSISD
jgi:hypothetical protein